MRGKRFDDLFKIIGYRITPAHAGKTFSVPLSSGRFQDHPRACGENRNCPKAKQKAHGSPPRMRGKRVPTGAAMPLPGITPAHAGKTSAGGLGMNAIKDHPRACGENINAALNQRIDIGSPPRMRGKRIRVFRRKRNIRITPAHAGKTAGQPCMCAVCKDHPRACGENII